MAIIKDEMGSIQDPAKGQTQQQGQAESQPDGQAEQSNVTLEEQDAYDKVVISAMKVLYDDQTHTGIMEMLKSGKNDPATALADVAATVILQLDKKSGNKIPEEVILPASEEILSMVAELAQKSGVLQVDDKTVNAATQKMIVVLGDAYGVSEEDIQELIKSLPQDQVQSMVADQQKYAGGM